MFGLRGAILTAVIVFASLTGLSMLLLWGLTLNPIYFLIFEPLPTVSYVVWLIWRTVFRWKSRHDLYHLFILIGVSFALAADYLIDASESVPAFFLPGFACFFLCHIFNLVGFSVRPTPTAPKLPVRILWAIPFWALGLLISLLIYFLSSSDIVIRAMIFVYAAIFTSAAWRAWARLDYDPENEDRVSQILTGVGYLLFMTSDIINGFTRFVGTFHPEGLREAIILGTYYTGVGLISLNVDRNFFYPRVNEFSTGTPTTPVALETRDSEMQSFHE